MKPSDTPIAAQWREAMRLYLRTLGLACRAAPGLALVLALAHLVQAGAPAVQVWVFKLLVDGVAAVGRPEFDPRALWIAGGLYAVSLFLAQAGAAVLGPVQDQINERVQGLICLRMLEIGDRQAGLAFYEDESVQNDLETVRRGLDYVITEAVSLPPYAVQQLIVAGTLTLLLARLHPVLPLLLLATMLPRIRWETRLQDNLWSALTARSPHTRRMYYYSRLLLGADLAKEVRIFGLGGFFLGRYRDVFERAHAELVSARRVEQRGATLYALLNAGVTGAAYAAIVLAAARGALTVGDVALFAGATFQLSDALAQLAGVQGALLRHRLLLRAFYALMDRPPGLGDPSPVAFPPRTGGDGRATLPETEGGPTPSPSRGGGRGRGQTPLIEFRHVSFTYPGSATPALLGLSLRIAPGEKLALVGENGAGKTTFVSLLARLYDPSEGEILVDGVPLRHLDLREWRRRLTSVSQEFLRLEAPLRMNLALGARENLDDDAALSAACEQVGFADALRALSRGLDQMLGRRFEGGVELSGGEWQKVALARALLRDGAGVVLMDEPTSALDAPTERALFQQFIRLAGDRTAVLISHRFSTLTMADRIVLLDGGQILEEGTHAELMARGGRYAELFALQATRYR